MCDVVESWRTTVDNAIVQTWLVPIGGAVLFTLANVCVKLSLKDKQWLMFVAFACSIAAYWTFRRLCILKGLAVTEGIFGSLITVLTVGVGILIFREVLTMKQMVGLGLILVGLFLIQ